MTQVDDVIEHYKSELLGEAEFARGDLQEIEDHLRALTEELHERGMPPLEAVRAACERLGDPRAVAREHARMRSPFGVRLSHARSISAALLMLLLLQHYLVRPVTGFDSAYGLATIFGMAMVIALLARLTWARPIVLGCVGLFAMFAIQHQFVEFGEHPLWLISSVGTVVFVMPWRRSELHRAGYALALQALAFGAAISEIMMAPAALIGFVALTIAISGTVLRARWAALASAVGAVSLLVTVIATAPGFFKISVHFAMVEWLPHAGVDVMAAVAAAAAAYMSWTSARSSAGTFQYVLR